VCGLCSASHHARAWAGRTHRSRDSRRVWLRPRDSRWPGPPPRPHRAQWQLAGLSITIEQAGGGGLAGLDGFRVRQKGLTSSRLAATTVANSQRRNSAPRSYLAPSSISYTGWPAVVIASSCSAAAAGDPPRSLTTTKQPVRTVARWRAGRLSSTGTSPRPACRLRRRRVVRSTGPAAPTPARRRVSACRGQWPPAQP